MCIVVSFHGCNSSMKLMDKWLLKLLRWGFEINMSTDVQKSQKVIPAHQQQRDFFPKYVYISQTTTIIILWYCSQVGKTEIGKLLVTNKQFLPTSHKVITIFKFVRTPLHNKIPLCHFCNIPGIFLSCLVERFRNTIEHSLFGIYNSNLT